MLISFVLQAYRKLGTKQKRQQLMNADTIGWAGKMLRAQDRAKVCDASLVQAEHHQTSTAYPTAFIATCCTCQSDAASATRAAARVIAWQECHIGPLKEPLLDQSLTDPCTADTLVAQ